MKRKCPKCGIEYSGHPAVSRSDNYTQICPDCGIREAMEYVGADPIDIENVVRIAREHRFDQNKK